MKLLLTTLLLVFSQLALAQLTYYSKYDWKENPEKFTISEQDKKEDEIILFEKRSIEYTKIGEDMAQMYLSHVIRLINTDAAIEENNKMYISNGTETTVLIQKARVIKPNGEIINLKESDIQESKDEEGNVAYRYFALDGLEKGCIIEYLHYLKQDPDYTGSVMTIQSETEKKKCEIDIISPKHLDFQIYPVNGMPALTLDTVDYFVRRKFLTVTDLKGLKNESQSPYYALLQKCYYKLNKNFDTEKSNFYNYTEVGKYFHESMFSVPEKKELKGIKSLIKEVEAAGGSNLEEKLRYLEYYIKANFTLIDANVSELENLAFVFEKKITSEAGMTKLFLQTAREMGVKVELVLTSDRDENPFLTAYEAYNFLDEYLVYIPELKTYFSPEITSRIGFPPYQLTYNKGLFIEEKKLNDLSIAISKIKDIKLVDANESIDEINARVDFSDNLAEPKVVIERKVSGYKAIFPQYILDFVDDERKTELKEDFLKYIDKDAKLVDASYENDNSKVAGKLPFVAKATFENTLFTEKAGDKILFKVGMLIGPQAELYNKEERTLPVQAEFNREYKRKLVIAIPEGYTIKNTNDLVFNVETADKSAGFVANFVISNGELIIDITEYYNKVYFPVAEYKGYENVMNAAADFNKLVLVLEKK